LQHAYNWYNVIATAENHPVTINNATAEGLLVNLSGNAVSGIRVAANDLPLDVTKSAICSNLSPNGFPFSVHGDLSTGATLLNGTTELGGVYGNVMYDNTNMINEGALGSVISNDGTNYYAGVYGKSFVDGDSSYAGYFDGNVNINGTLIVNDIFSNGSASFEGTVIAKNIIALDTLTTTDILAIRVFADEFQGGLFNGTTGTFSGAVNAPSFVGGTFAGTTINGTIITGTEFQGGLFNGTTGTFSGNVTAPEFHGSLVGGSVVATTGLFSGNVTAPEFHGSLVGGTVSGTTGSFTGTVTFGGVSNGIEVLTNAQFNNNINVTNDATIGHNLFVLDPTDVWGLGTKVSVLEAISLNKALVEALRVYTEEQVAHLDSNKIEITAAFGGDVHGTYDALHINDKAVTYAKLQDGNALDTANVLFWNGTVWNDIALNSDNVVEGSKNLFFTNARARAALSVDPVSPILYDTLTGIFSMTPVSSTANGYLSSADYNEFKAKPNLFGPNMFTGVQHFEQITLTNTHAAENSLPENLSDALAETYDLAYNAFDQIGLLSSMVVYNDSEFFGDVAGSLNGGLYIQNDSVTFDKLANGTAPGNILSWNGTDWVETTVPDLEADPFFSAALSTDVTLHDSSDVLVPSQSAVKGYADNAVKTLLANPNFFASTNTFGLEALDDTALVAINNSVTHPTVLL